MIHFKDILIVTPLLGVAFTMALIVFLKWLIDFLILVYKIEKIPGPFSIPVLGTSWEFIGVKREDVFDISVQRARKYPKIHRTWNGISPIVIVYAPEYVETILSSKIHLQKSIFYEQELKKWLGNGLVTSTGEHWHTHRKIITPTFHFSILEGFCEVFAEKSELLVKKLEAFADTGKPIDLFPILNKATLDTICETAMGINMNTLNDAKSEYTAALAELAEVAVQRFIRPWLYNDRIFRLTNLGRRSGKALKTLHDFTETVIKERKASRRQRNESESLNDFEDVGKKHRKAFLDLLLEETENKPFFTESDIREEVDTFMFAGHDTTAISLGWALYLIGHHPNVQNAIVKELNEIFGSSSNPPTQKDLGEMKYLDRVMKETIRIYPTVPGVSRKINSDITFDEYQVPKGSMVGVSFYQLNRDERHFPDPERFDPDRFSPENSQGRHPYAFTPFSAGPRNCIGMKFAQLEMKMVLSMILRHFRIKSVDPRDSIKVVSELVMRPINGFNIILEKRK